MNFSTYVSLFGRADTVNQWTGGTGNDVRSGGEGRDAMAGNLGNDTLSGAGGDDTLFGDPGDDTLNGDAGDDVLEGGSGADHINGGAGIDTLSYYYGAAVEFAFDHSIAATGDAVGDVISGMEILSGSNTGNDRLGGDARANTIYGNGGDDQIFGFAGKDTLIGGAGSDTLDGGTGDDIMAGGAGSDLFIGGSGNDTVSYFNDSAIIASLDPLAFTNGGAAIGDLFQGIENLSGSNTKADKLAGDGNANLLYGNGGNDLLYGKAGSDTLFGGKDTDTLDGGAGDDVLIGGDNGDKLIGGTGVDLVTYFSDAAVKAALDHSFASAGAALGDTFSGIENLAGSDTGNDVLAGDTRDNQIFGQGGSDKLYGRGGNDMLSGGKGADLLDGGTGGDMASYIGETGVTVALDGSIKNAGAALGDTLVSIESLSGSATAKDTLVGNAAANTLYGNGGNDVLSGLAGKDSLFGGLGADRLSGGSDRDQFYYFNAFEGGDTITDFSTGDLIVVEGAAFGLGQYKGMLDFSRFQFGAVQDSDDRFVFNQSSHTLSYDSDGTGLTKAVKIFTLANGFHFTPDMIYVI